MAIPVIMPKQGQSVETCIITNWFKKKGEVVHPGDILFSYETDKASFDMESTAEGTLIDIFFGEGAEVPVLANVAVIGAPGEDTSDFKTGDTHVITFDTGKVSPQKDTSGASRQIHVDNSVEAGRIRISPRAKRLAKNNELEYNNINGSGPNGRIILQDIEDALKNIRPKPDNSILATDTGFTEKPLTNVRRMIAKAMHTSLQNSAQLTHHMSADARNLLEARKAIKNDLANGKGMTDITLNDIICWCIIKSLKKFPEANSHFLDDHIKTFNGVHLGIAVDTQRGLMVPVIKDADQHDLANLSKELKSAAESCRKGNINPELLHSTSASFTVSNLGAYGVEMFTPVINLPQVAILGICTIVHRPADLGNGVIGFIPVIGLSLTYDHRAIDGGPATLFLKEVRNQIEKFMY